MPVSWHCAHLLGPRVLKPLPSMTVLGKVEQALKRPLTLYPQELGI